LLTDDGRRRLFCQAVTAATERHAYRLFAFVIMPEHVHLIVHPGPEAGTISELLNAIKRPFSFRVKKALQELGDEELLARLTIRQRPGVETFRFWQEGPGYDRNLTEPKTIEMAIDYVHTNPVRRGLCLRAIDWRWSSARFHLLSMSEVDSDLPRLSPIPPELLH
jgi:putative transposase